MGQSGSIATSRLPANIRRKRYQRTCSKVISKVSAELKYAGYTPSYVDVAVIFLAPLLSRVTRTSWRLALASASTEKHKKIKSVLQACGVRRTCTPKYKSLNTVIYPLWFTLHNLLLATEFISHLCNFSVVSIFLNFRENSALYLH